MIAFEKVSAWHPDKLADRIAGALVDLAYSKQRDPKVAVEVLIGHGRCLIINETSCHLENSEVQGVVDRIVKPGILLEYVEVPQDVHLSYNQRALGHAGDNGIFKGVPTSEEETLLAKLTAEFDKKYHSDGKYIVTDDDLLICQSNCNSLDVLHDVEKLPYRPVINPLGPWTGGTDVDSGATNRKLGSDMGRCVTGGGLHGKDLSKTDVSVNIYCYLEAQVTGKEVTAYCAIGDDKIHVGDKLVDYREIIETARHYIENIGGFEKFAEYGILRG